MRASLAIVAFGCAILVSAPSASADEQPSSSPKAESPSPPEAKDPRSSTQREAPPGKPVSDADHSASEPAGSNLPRSGVALLLPGGLATPSQVATDTKVDLFPPNLFGDHGTFQPFSHQNKERRAALDLGDDSDWRVQAAQIGVMAGAFAALVGLCSGGRCMLPESSSSWLPGFLQPNGQIMPEIRKEPELRQAR